MKKFLIAVLAALLPFAVQAADLAAGKTKAEQACASCHAVGNDWTKPLQPDYPRLGGQHKDYIITALNAYKQGDKSLIGRKNPVMKQFAGNLKDEDIAQIAAYFSKLTPSLTTEPRPYTRLTEQ